MSQYFILDGHKPVPCSDPIEWANWFKNSHRHVASMSVGDVFVSTVFLGIDHSFGEGEPMLFETMIFGGLHDGYQRRCSTWEEAETMHTKALDVVRGRGVS